ncbi:cell wall synthesis protein Wag31 [Asanoa iriomotensis]|uniref:Cell wall synthesis protein Wag31 n=2 Tax=Asanoa iriomotensis TaxID=234613 RepID=A0ABQ4C2M5_9ACTN|nr:cell wall synthesis protein Wag31 [Asanoa iriomotensis]
MPLTPADVHNVAFNKPSIGKRGYDQEEVDAFLDQLEQDLVRLIEENNDLRGAVARDGGSDWQGHDPRLAGAVEEMSARLERVLRDKAAAEQVARAVRAELEQARTGGGRATAGDREHATRVLTMAELTADSHLVEARREAQDLLSDARSTAQRIADEAVAAAEAMERSARERYETAMSELAAGRAATLQQIEELEALRSEYRVRLRAHVEGQMRDLGAPGRA